MEKPEKYQHMLQNLVFKAQQVMKLLVSCLSFGQYIMVIF